MKIIIPMSGMGQRFVNAGYKVPKPLIEMDGKPIIEHVVNMFSEKDNFVFICNSMHLRETEMQNILNRIAPGSTIVEIEPHKFGPVYAVDYVSDIILDDEEVIVNYCDFSVYWDYHDFLDHTRNRNADGAVPAYKGFHPHMLGTTNYAFMRDDQQWMLEIKEKEPFTNNRMNEYASVGTYYFKKGRYVKKYFKQLMDHDINLNGEYYVSLIYNLLVNDGLSVSIYDIQHMLQWGTPQDVEEYNGWSEYFKRLSGGEDTKVLYEGINLIPLAGAGSRFVQEGYDKPKPLIDVSGKPMILQATDCLPKALEYRFICRKEHLDRYDLQEILEEKYNNSGVLGIDYLTEGQACTCKLGLNKNDREKPLIISACDNGIVYNNEKLNELIKNEEIDMVVWSFRNHPSSSRNPEMYGWLKCDSEDNVLGVSVKKKISDTPENDHAIVGTFYFKKAGVFFDAYDKMIANNIRVNGEFYVDSLVGIVAEMGMKVKVFEVNDYICWGTPNDLKTYEYWQSFFHKVSWHPYNLNKDPMIETYKVDELNKKYRGFSQEWR